MRCQVRRAGPVTAHRVATGPVRARRVTLGPSRAGRVAARSALALLVPAALALAGCGASSATQAAGATSAPTAAAAAGRPTAIVAMGDGYLSGEGGRWEGNGAPMPTDRTCARYPAGACPGYDSAAQHDPAQYHAWEQQIAKIYLPPSHADGCDRSDTAEISSSAIAVDQKINIACSGASTANVIPAAQGGQARNGEASQADQLAQIAKNYHIKMIVLSIGADDLGLAAVLSGCTQDLPLRRGDCESGQRAAVNARTPQALAAIERTIEGIRGVMTAAGYPVGSYLFVYQSYLSPIAAPAANSVPETPQARAAAGCPIDNLDEGWITGSLVPQVLDMQRQVAEDKDVVLLDLQRAGAGHEVCDKHTQRVSSRTPRVNPGTVEWFRAVQLRPRQGDIREFMHPNAIMQRALGRCLELLYAENPAGSTDKFCTNTPGQGWTGMAVS